MTGSRSARMWDLMAVHAAGRGGQVSVGDAGAVAAVVAGVDGAWLTGVSAAGAHLAMQVTDVVAERLAECELTVGEGPCHSALSIGAPVLVPDLGEVGGRWPVFSAEARRVGAAAVFAFPLAVGAIEVGVLGLYRGTAGFLTLVQYGDALIVADAAMVLLLEQQGGNANPGSGGVELADQLPDLEFHRAEIDQATGMLTEQLGVTIADAFVRLRAYAFSQDRRLAEVAADIVARRLRLNPNPDGQL